MKKLFMILHLTLILYFMVGCQDKEVMADDLPPINVTHLEREY
jgi:hypothetical protein